MTISTAGAANVASAHSAPTLHRGAGAVIAHGTDFVGQYRIALGGRNVAVYCINPDRRQPTHLSMTTVRHIPGLSPRVTAQMAEVLAAHGQSEHAATAEATSQALNYLAGNRAAVARRAHWIAGSTQKLAMSYVAEARRLRGEYAVTMHLSTAALPGQSGRGVVSVRSAVAGKATTVTLSHTGNVSTPARVRTNSHGVGTFGYRTTDGGQVRIRATVDHLAPSTVRVSSPAAGYQRMVSTSESIRVHADASYQGRVGGFTNSYRCDSECAGHPVVTLSACAPGSAAAARLTFAWAGGSSALDFPASGKRTCHSLTVRLADRARVTAAWQYRTSRGWTAPMLAAGSFVVDCPAAPPVAVAMSYDCSAGSFTAALGTQHAGSLVPLHNTSGHPMVLTVKGAFAGHFVLAPGATDTAHTWPISCGRHARVSVQAGIRRASGAWNYGRLALVTAP